jgi:hypothetical protein
MPGGILLHWGPTLEILQKPWQECLDILLTTFIEGAPYAPNIKRLCNGEYRPGQLYILSSRVAPDITDADVHALCTKPAVLKMKESGKSSRNHRTVRGRTETCRHQVNESMYSCSGRYSPLQSLLMFGAEFVPRSVVLSPVCTTL